MAWFYALLALILTAFVSRTISTAKFSSKGISELCDFIFIFSVYFAYLAVAVMFTIQTMTIARFLVAGALITVLALICHFINKKLK